VSGAAPTFVPIRQASVSYSIVVSTSARSRGCSGSSACAAGGIRVLANVTGMVTSNAAGEVEIHPPIDPAFGPVHVWVNVSLSSGAQRTAEIDVLPTTP
jgi:hypothetical protein